MKQIGGGGVLLALGMFYPSAFFNRRTELMQMVYVSAMLKKRMPTPKRKGNRGERTIITIHGIRTDGPWQESFEEVFEPHFHYESFKYTQFQHSVLAVILLALEWLALILALSSVVWAWRAGWLAANPMLWVCAGLWAVSIVLAANLIADRLRDGVVRDFINFVDAANGSGLPPHIVAHSLGSFVLGRMLLRYPEFKTGKVVLLGCVLRPGFDWGSIRAQFQLIRNELGSKDWVSSLACFLSPFIREMGSAGKTGFQKPLGSVLNLKREEAGTPWRKCICGSCGGGGPDAAVLNIDGQGIGHDDLTAVMVRARRRWLPYFWDIPPDHFEGFINLCLECDEMEANGDPALQKKIAELLGGCWFWSQGPLEGFLRRYVNGLAAHPNEEYIRSVAANLFRTIAKANRTDGQGERRLLFPMRAVTFSVKRALEESRL